MKVLARLATIVALLMGNLFAAAASPANASTMASGVHILVYCPHYAVPNGLYYQLDSTTYPQSGFARLEISYPGAAQFGFGANDVPELAHISVGCDSGTWRWYAQVTINKTPVQKFWMDCTTLLTGGRCPITDVT